MKIAIGQINTRVGDIKGNAAKIKKYISNAYKEKTDLIVFPELALSGYPPLDLMMNRDFISANLAELENLAKAVWHPACAVGFIDINPSQKGKPLLNSVAFMHKGKILAKRSKTLLPSYDVFDEARFFESSRQNAPVEFQKKKIALTICEDLLGEMEIYEKRKLYKTGLAKSFAKQKPDLIVNMSASPYWKGKKANREKTLTKIAGKFSTPVIYANMAGANDGMVFDGNSFYATPKSGITARAGAFVEELLVFDFFSSEEAPVREENPEKEIVDALVLGIKDFFHKQGFSKAVLGISGGVDSAVCASLAVRALGEKNVNGALMPSRYTSPETLKDAEKLCKNLSINHSVIPIDHLLKAYEDSLFKKSDDRGIAHQNIQARIRADILMTLSNKNGWLPLATGNKSEIAMGYSTMYGDSAGALAPIADILKTEVYQIARFLNREKETIPAGVLKRAPSAELKPDQKDEDDLGRYEILDKIIRLHVEENKTAEEIIAEGFSRKTTLSILRRIENLEYKRQQMPPGLKISKKSFGPGRRMPIVKDTSFIRK